MQQFQVQFGCWWACNALPLDCIGKTKEKYRILIPMDSVTLVSFGSENHRKPSLFDFTGKPCEKTSTQTYCFLCFPAFDPNTYSYKIHVLFIPCFAYEWIHIPFLCFYYSCIFFFNPTFWRRPSELMAGIENFLAQKENYICSLLFLLEFWIEVFT